mgnify:CR=1 FL=1
MVVRHADRARDDFRGHRLGEAVHGLCAAVDQPLQGAGIRILGDVPIFVAHDSADVWTNREQFKLDEDGRRRLHSNPLRILDTKNPAMQDLVNNAPKLLDYLEGELPEAGLDGVNRMKLGWGHVTEVTLADDRSLRPSGLGPGGHPGGGGVGDQAGGLGGGRLLGGEALELLLGLGVEDDEVAAVEKGELP